MDLRQFRYFVAVIECGSISAAADALKVPRDSLHLHLDLLREAFGMQLLITRKHVVTPTPAGLILLEGARLMIQQLEGIKSDMIQLTAKENNHDGGSTPSVLRLIKPELGMSEEKVLVCSQRVKS